MHFLGFGRSEVRFPAPWMPDGPSRHLVHHPCMGLLEGEGCSHTHAVPAPPVSVADAARKASTHRTPANRGHLANHPLVQNAARWHDRAIEIRRKGLLCIRKSGLCTTTSSSPCRATSEPASVTLTLLL